MDFWSFLITHGFLGLICAGKKSTETTTAGPFLYRFEAFATSHNRWQRVAERVDR